MTDNNNIYKRNYKINFFDCSLLMYFYIHIFIFIFTSENKL